MNCLTFPYQRILLTILCSLEEGSEGENGLKALNLSDTMKDVQWYQAIKKKIRFSQHKPEEAGPFKMT